MIIRTKDSCIATGFVSKVTYGTSPNKGTPMLKFSLSVGNKLYLSCVAWGEYAKRWQLMQDGMEVLVAGAYSERTYKTNDGEDKISFECNVTFMSPNMFFMGQNEEIKQVEQVQVSEDSSDELPF